MTENSTDDDYQTTTERCWSCLSSQQYVSLFVLPSRYHFAGDQPRSICPDCLERQFQETTPIVTLRDGAHSAERLTNYAFATQLLPDVRSGGKTGTVRYGDQRDIGRQEVVGAVHPDTDDLVALLRITGWAEAPVRVVPRFFEAMQAQYPHQTPKAVCDALNEHYDTTIYRSSPVRALAYDLLAVVG